MPGTTWSAPVPELSAVSLVTSSFTTATLTDISPLPCLIPAGTLNLGTRIRCRAAGEYTATTTASSVTWGFYVLNQGGTFSSGALALAATASTAVVVATAWPFIIEYTGVVEALSQNNVNSTTAKVVGQGWSLLPASLTSFTGPTPIPVTAAARTVNQTANALNTSLNLIVSFGVTVATNTGLTSITCDEMTCELIG